MMKINDLEVADHYVEFGIETLPGTIIECADEEDARAKIAFYGGGKLFAQEWFAGAWAPVD